MFRSIQLIKIITVTHSVSWSITCPEFSERKTENMYASIFTIYLPLSCKVQGFAGLEGYNNFAKSKIKISSPKLYTCKQTYLTNQKILYSWAIGIGTGRMGKNFSRKSSIFSIEAKKYCPK